MKIVRRGVKRGCGWVWSLLEGLRGWKVVLGRGLLVVLPLVLVKEWSG
jgi:hypothetical protein